MTDRNTTNALRQAWADYRGGYGFKRVWRPLLSPPSANLKLGKTAKAVYGLSLAQSNTSGINVCPHSTPNCRAACVAKNGHGERPAVSHARIVKTRFYHEHTAIFRALIAAEIKAAVKRHGAGNVEFRLNTFSDIAWENVAPEWFDIDGASFYDYTKFPATGHHARAKFPRSNYRLARSITERHSIADVAAMLAAGETPVVVVDHYGSLTHMREVPTQWAGMPAVSGDHDDNRSDDPEGVVVLLGAKGRMNGLAMAKPLNA